MKDSARGRSSAIFYIALAATVAGFTVGTLFYKTVENVAGAPQQYQWYDASSFAAGFLVSCRTAAKLQLFLFTAAYTVYAFPAGIVCLLCRSVLTGACAASMLAQSPSGFVEYLLYALYTLAGAVSLYFCLCSVCRAARFSSSSRYFARSAGELFLSRNSLRFAADFILLTGLSFAAQLAAQLALNLLY